MVKKIFAGLGVLASLVWIADIAITVNQGNVGPAVAVKSALVVVFLYYAFRSFFGKKASGNPTSSN